MEEKALIEQDKQDLEENSVQTSEKDHEKPKKKRTAEQKIGRQRVHEHKTDKILAILERLLQGQRWTQHKTGAIRCRLIILQKM